MEKEALVVAVDEQEVRLRYTRHSACRKCGACLVFGNSGGEQEIVLPRNQLALAKGDRVVIGLKNSSLLKASFLVYALPLLLFLLGYLGGTRGATFLLGEASAEVGGLVGGVLALVLAYVGLNRYDQRLRRTANYQPYIARVLEDAAPQ